MAATPAGSSLSSKQPLLCVREPVTEPPGSSALEEHNSAEWREETVEKVVKEGFTEEVTSEKRIRSSPSLGPWLAPPQTSRPGTGGQVHPYRLAPGEGWGEQWSSMGCVSSLLLPGNYPTAW